MTGYVAEIKSSFLHEGRKYDLCSLPFRKKYRCHFEIIALVLEAIKDNGVTPFSLMKHASINCSQLKRYLQSLIEMGFIEVGVKEGRVSYRASEKGLGFLRQYYILLEILFSSASNKPTNIGYEAEYDALNGQQHSATRFVRR